MRASPRQRGVAIIAVLASILIISTLLLELGTNTTVDSLSGANARDQMRAELLGRSALNLAQLVIKVQTDVLDKHREQLGDIQLGEYAGLFMGAFGGGKEEVQAFGESLGMMGADAFEGLGSEGGTFDLQLATDDGKINLNCANGSVDTQATLKAQLDALLYFDAYNPLFERPDASGWRRDRALQATSLIDYIDRDQARYGAPGTPEDYGYESLDDRYKAKNNYLDTLGEIRLARGVDDTFWTIFGQAFTIYGGCKVNIGAVSDPKLIAAIIYLSAKNPDDPVLRDTNALMALAEKVAEAKGFGITFDDVQAFADYVANPGGAMNDLYAKAGLAPPPDVAAATQGQPGQVGVELDATKLGQIVSGGPRRTYRVEIEVEVPRGAVTDWSLRRKLTAVWDSQTQNQNARDPRQARGAWVFYQEH
jgi:type II secretory pathway component PulK